MIYRTLGNTGLPVPILGLGTHVTFGNQISYEMAERIVTVAYDSGVNLFETSEAYADGAAEITLGRILKSQNWRRSSYLVATRLSHVGGAITEQTLSRKRLMEGLRDSLERLQLEYVDIVIVTRDRGNSIAIEEIVRTCTHLIHIGWAFYWGTCNWTTSEIMQAQSVARQFNLIPSCLESFQYNILQRDQVQYTQELCAKLNLGLITGAPLCCGILTGKYEHGIPGYSRATLNGQHELVELIRNPTGPIKKNKIDRLRILATSLQCTCAQLAIAYCLKTAHISCVLLGVATVDQLQENLEAIEVYPKLTVDVLAEIDLIFSSDSSESML